MRTAFIDRTVKSLTDQFGRTVTFKNEIARSMNVRTGDFSRQYQSCTAKCLIAPAKKKRGVVYDISYLRANSNFVMGGDFEEELLEVTVRTRLLPADFKIEQSTVVVISNVVYLIHEINSDMATGDSYRRLIVSRTDTIDYGQIVVAGKISKCGAKTVSPTVVIA